MRSDVATAARLHRTRAAVLSSTLLSGALLEGMTPDVGGFCSLAERESDEDDEAHGLMTASLHLKADRKAQTTGTVVVVVVELYPKERRPGESVTLKESGFESMYKCRRRSGRLCIASAGLPE